MTTMRVTNTWLIKSLACLACGLVAGSFSASVRMISRTLQSNKNPIVNIKSLQNIIAKRILYTNLLIFTIRCQSYILFFSRRFTLDELLLYGYVVPPSTPKILPHEIVCCPYIGCLKLRLQPIYLTHWGFCISFQ